MVVVDGEVGGWCVLRREGGRERVVLVSRRWRCRRWQSASAAAGSGRRLAAGGGRQGEAAPAARQAGQEQRASGVLGG